MTAPGPFVEVSCDESGYEGEKLVGGTTRLFAHAGVHLDAGSATACMQELRDRIRSPATEYKATHVLREKHRVVLRWLLGESGPLRGAAQVYLVDKPFFVVGKVIDLLLDGATDPTGIGSDPGRRAMALLLSREGLRTLGSERWEAFLGSANDLMRDRLDGPAVVDRFFEVVHGLRGAGAAGEVDAVLRLLGRTRPHAESFRARLLDDPPALSAVDPLVPAIVRAVAYWGQGQRGVRIVHDRQTTLSGTRAARLLRMSGLAGISFADSRWDARVQVADVVAGAVRKIAENELTGQGDAELTALLPPYVDEFSVWADDRSWSLVGPASSRSPAA
ncbi:MAG TPA: hypothetical protein VHN18_06205 [Micromonosporaceae bacterium]|nr:hypothetical protein [Micromonosporaceae bacterium]